MMIEQMHATVDRIEARLDAQVEAELAAIAERQPSGRPRKPKQVIPPCGVQVRKRVPVYDPTTFALIPAWLVTKRFGS